MKARRTDTDDTFVEAHEINVTPFIDVMLVLLIIFMVAAPLATVDVKVDLPTSGAAPAPRPDHPLYLTVGADKAITVDTRPVAKGELAAVLDEQSKGDKETRIFLRADKTVDYATLMAVMDALREGGYLKVALVGQDGGQRP